MKLESGLSGVIASRTLEFVSSSGVRTEYLISIGKPVPDESGENYFCPHEIRSFGSSKVINIYGIDAFQALDLSLKTISPYLEYLERELGGKFYSWGELGHMFPKL